MKKKEIFIIGAKGIPAKYGGFESFVEELTAGQKSPEIHYNVACRRDLSDNKNDYYTHNNALCFNVDVPNIGSAAALIYDYKAFEKALELIRTHNITEPIVYVLACRIGPFIRFLQKKLEKYDGILFVNPDGHEWLRAKWSYPVRMYWRFSERLMVKHADLLICDSQNIESYILNQYGKYNPKTTYIAYGSEVKSSLLENSSYKVTNWYHKFNIKMNDYYLIVGRFVPENNYESMIANFIKSNTKKDLVIITNVKTNKFYHELRKKTNFDKDNRIKFVGTVYDSELLRYIRENAYAYIHGHEVGGTNPSLLEALASTKVNLLLDVGFNREVGANGAVYWDKGNLYELINQCDDYSEKYIECLNEKSSERIIEHFSWKSIIGKYESKFLLH
ncbi:beta 1-4 rhamnosyltransferase Cps2T [Lactiplantibacillus plantarum]|uniref:beta 1-4 rhamnosyltransferase Cps2T n=1 Tax=Lactiplantibacillus plantarum TaxID=1590 RepID=UPI003852429F|nr:glycosyl transferase [Lactiplantibacillus plantarum]